MILHSRPTLDKSDFQTVMKVMQSGYISQGKKVREFEKALASYIGLKDGVAVSSGTSALHLALIALGISAKGGYASGGKAGDEVIIPTYICTAPLNAIYYTKAKPVIVDINEEDCNISIFEVKKKLTRRTKAIIVPHMFGLPADMDEILDIGVPVIEDCAHSIGAKYKGRKVGSLGTLSVFSFYATKMLTTGEGGMVLSNNKKLLSKIRDIRDYDEKNDFKIRFNYKMTDIEAALGLNQLNKLSQFIKRRAEIAKKYDKAFSGCDFTVPVAFKERVYYRYVIKVGDPARAVIRSAEKYIQGMKNKGVQCRKPVYKPIHQYFKLRGFQVAERIHKSAISIPLYPSLTDKEVDFIIKAIISIARGATSN